MIINKPSDARQALLWPGLRDYTAIQAALQKYVGHVVVTHGACRGLRSKADAACNRLDGERIELLKLWISRTTEENERAAAENLAAARRREAVEAHYRPVKT